MINRYKTVVFYKWTREDGKTYNVLGERSGGGGLLFSVYEDKEKLEDKDGELALRFAKELAKS
jgi:hypothetical protein